MAAIAVKSAKLGAGLVARGLEGFQHRHEVELQPSGIAELDAVLGGAAQRQYSLRLRFVGFLSNLSWKIPRDGRLGGRIKWRLRRKGQAFSGNAS